MTIAIVRKRSPLRRHRNKPMESLQTYYKKPLKIRTWEFNLNGQALLKNLGSIAVKAQDFADKLIHSGKIQRGIAEECYFP